MSEWLGSPEFVPQLRRDIETPAGRALLRDTQEVRDETAKSRKKIRWWWWGAAKGEAKTALFERSLRCLQDTWGKL